MADQPLQVVFLDRDTISPQTSLRQLSFEHTLTVYGRTSRDQVAERIADADIVITTKVALRQEALEQAGRLKIVAVAAPGDRKSTRLNSSHSCASRMPSYA